MLIDLPPGTGDVQLSISQLCEVAGAVIVSTPQDVALLDAVKAVNMFSKVDIDIVGMIENMSQFVCPHCEKTTEIFSSNGAKKASGKIVAPFLGSIPIDLESEGVTFHYFNRAVKWLVVSSNGFVYLRSRERRLETLAVGEGSQTLSGVSAGTKRKAAKRK